jgi:hypothetical protein
MGRYAAWWKRLSKFENFHSYGSIKGSFEKTFGLTVEKAWSDFTAWMAIKKPVVTAIEPVEERFRSVNALAAGKGRLFWADELAVWEWEPGKEAPTRLFSADGLVNRLSPSPDGTKSWCPGRASSTACPASCSGAGTWRKRLAREAMADRAPGGRMAPDGSGIVASRIEGYTQDIIEIKDGHERVLFKGTERLVPGNPCPLADGSLAFLLKVDGEVMVAKRDADGKVSVLDSDAFSIPHASRTVTANIRNLSASGTDLSFCWDADLSLHKLARLGADGLAVQATSLSGGIQYPVALDGSLYYAGSFSDGQLICRYQRQIPTCAQAVQSDWRPLPAELFGLASAYDAPPSMEARPWCLPRSSFPSPFHLLSSIPSPATTLPSWWPAPDSMANQSTDPGNMLAWRPLALERSLRGRVPRLGYKLPVFIVLSASDALLPPPPTGASSSGRPSRLSLARDQPHARPAAPSPGARRRPWS